ncbi:MAG: VCBS repeat-containing protein, partial [Planctomycetes bacterium]|nr:VCBS repeat-containing protein [Planctomycetota bacterium]
AGQSDVDRLVALFDEVTKELSERAANKDRALIMRIRRAVSKVEDGQVFCEDGSKHAVRQLRSVDLAELACVKEKKILLGLLELYRGNSAGAKTLFDENAAKPPDAVTSRWLQQLQWVEAIGREDLAAKLLDEAKKLADQNKWKDAGEAMARLGSQCGETAFVEKNRAAVNDLNKRIAAATVRKEVPIRPFIDVTDKCPDLAKALKTFRVAGGWVVDINSDGLLDIALDIRRKAGDSPLLPVFLNETKPGGTELVFRDATQEANIDAAGVDAGRVVDEPICWADLNGDGDLDIVCRGLWTGSGDARRRDVKRLALYENVGKGRFKLDPDRSLTPDITKTAAYANFGFANIAVLDADGDGRPDILGEYVGPIRTLCLFTAVPHKPFVFDDATEKAGFLKGFAPPAFLAGKAWPQYVVFDCDGDDRQDILYNSDAAVLLRNGARGGFKPFPDAGLAYQTYASAATGNSPIIIPAVADYDNDGKIDVFVPQQGQNLLMQGQGDGTFKDVLKTTGPMATHKADSLWATWGDVNNDGLPDLFVCNADVRNRLYIQLPNHAFADKADEYGVAGEKGEKTNYALFADFDRDGDLDLIVLREGGRSQLLLNPFVEGDNRYYVSVIVRPPLGALGAKVFLYQRPGDQVVGFQQVARVEGFNRQTPPEAFFGVPNPGEYGVKVVLSNGVPIRRTLSVRPDARNEIVIAKDTK